MAAIGSPTGEGFEQYASEIYGWAYRLLGRHHDALDVVQDVFLRWDAQCARKAPTRPHGWLRRVTLNRAIDLRRQRYAVSESPDLLPSRQSGQGDTAAQLDQEVLRDDVAAAFCRLSDVQRSVLVAKVYDDLTFAQIAAELELAVSTVKTHYLRAVQSVRGRLQQRWSRKIGD